jgi:hypothetical protein
MNDDLTNGLGALPPLAPMPLLEPFNYQEKLELARLEGGLPGGGVARAGARGGPLGPDLLSLAWAGLLLPGPGR